MATTDSKSPANPERGGEKKKENKLLAARRARKQLDLDLDQLEERIENLRILHEQYFVDVLPHPPVKLQREAVQLIRRLLKAPFKNSQSRFRLRTLITRYQTYHTYWERVMREREEGRYVRDIFKADLRQRAAEEAKFANTKAGAAEKGLRQLYDSYEAAAKKVGMSTGKMDFDSFKSSLMKNAKALKEQHGVKKLQYKVVVKDGKVVVRASVK